MKRKTRSDWRQAIEALLRDAARTLTLLPMAGAMPSGFRSCMPQPLNGEHWDRDTGYGSGDARRRLTRDAAKVRRTATTAAITRMDFVIVALYGAKLSPLDRELLWARAHPDVKVRGWKAISAKTGIPVRTLQFRHRDALIEFCTYVIARKREHVARFSLRTFGGKAA